MQAAEHLSAQPQHRVLLLTHRPEQLRPWTLQLPKDVSTRLFVRHTDSDRALRTIFATVFKLYVGETSRDSPDVIMVDLSGVPSYGLAKTLAVIFLGASQLDADRAKMCNIIVSILDYFSFQQAVRIRLWDESDDRDRISALSHFVRGTICIQGTVWTLRSCSIGIYPQFEMLLRQDGYQRYSVQDKQVVLEGVFAESRQHAMLHR